MSGQFSYLFPGDLNLLNLSEKQCRNCIKSLILFWEGCLSAPENLHMNVFITVIFVRDKMNRKQVKDYILLCDYIANEYFNS